MRFMLVLFSAFPALAAPSLPKLDYATYLPGNAKYGGIDSAGNLYFSGTANSPCSLPPVSPPSLAGAYGSISQLQPAGGSLAWTACLPGAITGFAVAADGTMYLANTIGQTTTVSKLAPNASKILYSTSLPFTGALSLAIDSAGNVYLAGKAFTGFQGTKGVSCPGAPATCDGFLIKLNTAGSIQYATYVLYSPSSVAADSQGAAWFTGTANFSYASLNLVSTPLSFIGKFDSKGQMVFSTSFGGEAPSRVLSGGFNTAAGLAIAVDSNDAAYAVGYGTYGVPTTPGSLQPTYSGGGNLGYVIKFDSSGKLIYGTYVGLDVASFDGDAITIDASGNAYIGVPGPLFTICGGGPGARVAEISADGSKIISSWVFPGSGYTGIWQDGKGGLYVAGGPGATAFITTPGAYLTQYPFGTAGGFAAKYDLTLPSAPALSCLVNSGSNSPGYNAFGPNGAVAPGELVTLFGQGFPPGAGLNVTFDGRPAPVLYADSSQINAVVPFAAGFKTPFTSVSISNGSQTIGPYSLPVAQAQPGVFYYIANKTEASAALNQDGSVNSSTNPARAGSTVTVFGTGLGLYNQPLADGSLGVLQPPFPAPVIGLSAGVRDTNEPIPILFAGQAPGLVAGVVQINLLIPADIPNGPMRFNLYVGNYLASAKPLFVTNDR